MTAPISDTDLATSLRWEAERIADRDNFRSFLVTIAAEGNPRAPAAAAAWEQAMRDIDSGLDAARSTWHSISGAQRAALLRAHAGLPTQARGSTLMVLHRHGLLDGVRISDKGRFVVLTAIREHAPGTPA